jgi:hypothetical protein
VNAKKPLRALFFLSSIELALYLLIATVAWAVADHDLASLQSSFFSDVQTRLHAQILAGVQVLFLLVNAVTFFRIMRSGEKSVAVAGALVALGVAALFFLPTYVSVYGLGGLIGLAIAVKILGLAWKLLSWPFRRKKADPAKAEAPAPKPAAGPKT